MGVNDVLLAADLALDQQVTVVEPEDRLVICLRHSIMPPRPLPDHMRVPGLDDEWIDRMAEALDDACLATGLAPHFVAFQIDRDHDVHAAVAARMRTQATFATPTLETVLREVQSGVAVIAMRYHAGICAILSGRPSVLIAYAGKIDALATEVGPVVRNEPAAFSGIAGLVVSAISNGERTLEVRAHLQKREHNNDMALDRLLEQP
jgi:polysaccharide pyruvyl transferase WcaK-like protein